MQKQALLSLLNILSASPPIQFDWPYFYNYGSLIVVIVKQWLKSSIGKHEINQKAVNIPKVRVIYNIVGEGKQTRFWVVSYHIQLQCTSGRNLYVSFIEHEKGREKKPQRRYWNI